MNSNPNWGIIRLKLLESPDMEQNKLFLQCVTNQSEREQE